MKIAIYGVAWLRIVRILGLIHAQVSWGRIIINVGQIFAKN